MDRDQGLSPLPKLHESSQCRMVPKARPPEHKPGGGIIPGACQLWQCTRLAVHALARRQWHGGRALGRLRGRHGHSRDHRWRTRTPADLPDGSLVGSRGPCAIFQGRRGRAKQSRPACFAFARANGARQAAQVDTAWRVCWRRCAARPLAVVSPARRDLYARVHYRTSSRGFRVGRGIRVSRGGCLCGLWPDIRCRDRVLSIRSSQSVPWRLPSEAFLASHPACSTGAVACSSPAGWRLR